MLKDENYITICGWMRNRLNLGGHELLCYAMIYGFSQNKGGRFSGSFKYIAEWLGCCERTAINVVDKLIDKGLVIKRNVEVNGRTYCEYEVNEDMTEAPKEQKTKTERKSKKAPLIEREPENDLEIIEKDYLLKCRELYGKGYINTERPVINWTSARKRLKDLFNEVSVPVVLSVLETAMTDEWIIERGFMLTTILSGNVFGRLMNAKKKPKGVGVGKGVDEYDGEEVF